LGKKKKIRNRANPLGNEKKTGTAQRKHLRYQSGRKDKKEGMQLEKVERPFAGSSS